MLEVTILLENLKKSVSFTQHAVSQRSQLPILLNFLLIAEKEGFFITATDLEIGIKTKIPAKIKQEGSVAVSARTFSEIIVNLGHEKADLVEKEGKLVLTSGGQKTNFSTTPPEEFPSLYQERGEKKAVFEKEELGKDLLGVLFAASQDIGRPALSGVFIEKEEGEEGVRLVATDGFRLSLKKNFAKGVFDKKQAQKYLFPSRVIRELRSVGGDEKSIVFYTASSGNQVVFEAGEVEIVGRLIEAEYPDYRKIIPADFETSAVFDKKEALDAVKTCLVFAREAANIIRVGIGAGKAVFRASAPSVGESEVEIEAKIDGEENEIAFNGRYLLDFLSNTDSEDVRFEMTGPLNPGVFKLPKDPDYLHIIMPIRVGE